MSEIDSCLTGVILDEHLELDIAELCRLCRIDLEEVVSMVAEGILEPRGMTPQDWRFSGHALVRVTRALHLQRDLRVNLPGAALALDLLEELELLRCSRT
jgi:chaperone modulatory protein CbpM